MALTDKLSAIGSAIREKTGKTDLLTLDQMPTEILSIQGGGSPLDPVQVYNDTRPSDWLAMPTPNENEMYILFHIPEGVSSLIAFTVTCTGDYTVELGTVSNGTFTQHSSTSLSSGVKYESELFADDYGDLTSDGMKQVMLKVSGTDILTWTPSSHSKRSYTGWNIVEISCNLPFGTSVTCGSSSYDNALTKLRYFEWYGENSVTDMSYMFPNCYSLTSIPALDTSSVTNMYRMFYYCSSLTSIPALDTSSVTDMSYMFQNCYSLTSIPALDTSSVTSMYNMFCNCYSLTSIPALDTSSVTSMYYMFQNCYSLTSILALDTSSVTSMNNMFYYCYSLTSIPALDTSSVTSMNNMFQNCYSLTSIPALDTSSVTSMNNMFGGCYSLAKLLLLPTVSGWAGYAVSLKNCSLSHLSIVEFFNSLPTITSSKGITLTGNPGVSELTDAEKAIATEKGWTLTI